MSSVASRESDGNNSENVQESMSKTINPSFANGYLLRDYSFRTDHTEEHILSNNDYLRSC